MKRHWIQLGLGVGVLFLLAGQVPAPARAQASPLADLRAANTQLNKLAQTGATDAQLKKFVNALIEFDVMAENTLRAQWPTLTLVQKGEFKKLFQGIIEKNYIEGIRKNSKYTVDYQKEEVKGAEAVVFTVVHSVRRGRPRQTEVSYRMRRVSGRWRVIDMKTDDVSMEENYRSSFSRIIKDKGFAELLTMMRKRLTST